MTKHINAFHVGNKPGLKPYKCKHCEKRFTYRKNLKDHLSKDHGEDTPDVKNDTLDSSDLYPVKCDQCDASFKKRQSLKDHVQSAHENIIYKCLLCTSGEYWKAKKSAKRHLLQVHSIGKSRTPQDYRC